MWPAGCPEALKTAHTAESRLTVYAPSGSSSFSLSAGSSVPSPAGDAGVSATAKSRPKSRPVATAVEASNSRTTSNESSRSRKAMSRDVFLGEESVVFMR